MDGDPQSAVTPEELIHGRPDREQKKTIRAFYREKYPDIPKEETEKLAADMKPNVEYYDLLELMNYKYGILPCGEGKLLLCASDKPAEDDLACILAGETYLSMHQDFRIKPDHFGVDDDKSVYDYYRVYESERAVVFIPNERLFDRKPGESDEDRRKREHDRIDLVTTFTFIMEMATFRNTSLRMISEKISAAILQGGDVSYSYLKDIYRDLANTGKYADRFKFKYYGTQLEAAHIIEAFRTGELEEEYLKQKEFLESYIELYNASRGKLTSSAVSIAAAAVSIISIKDFFADMISQIALKTGVPILDPSNMFYEMLFAVMLLYILTRYILFRKEASDREKNLIETYKARFTFLERFRPDNEINEKPDGKDRQNEEG